MSFYDFKKQYDGFDFKNFCRNLSDLEIVKIINKENLSETDFLALLSPKALNRIEDMAQKASAISTKHFGKSVLLYAPLYVSNFCINNCVYCGFSTANAIKREVLNFKEIEDNCKIVSGYGIRHILLVCGESPVKTSLEYLQECIKILRKYFDCVDIEIYPLEESGYEQLREAGADGLAVYQETYDEDLYKILHTKGAKTNYRYRIETCERAGRAGYRSLNVGALLGLNDFVSEMFFAGLHAKYLQKNFPQSEIGISFPRLRPAAGGYEPKTIISDKHIIQAICAVRLFINRINVSVSTRESNALRKNAIPLGITRLSAASSTQVGGYAKSGKDSDGQFKINDGASVEDVKKMIYEKGYQPIMKDWLSF
ncbi:MAG: 2-iminoacetate synthase ThiH [Endomicrobium sp.]|jgi:2-iminoacetate synthase|nr:2-iminoacetate synthase ThiH [Endomicrobium sp.]